MNAMDKEEKNVDSGRPGVRNKEELGSRKKEREKDVERDQSLLPCQYSQRASSTPPTSPPERWNDEARERSSK